MKIGLLPFYLALYDNAVPENGRKVRPFADKIAAALKARGFDVVQSPACRLKNEFADAVKLFETSGCEAIATLHLAYSPSLESIGPLSATALPLVIIDTTPDYEFIPPGHIMANHGIHGVQDFCNLLIRYGKPFLLSAGHWEKSDVLDRIAKQLKSAGMAWRITHSRVGKVGGDFDGMGDFRVPDGTFGMQIVNYTPQAEPAEAEIDAELALDRERFVWDDSVTDEKLKCTLNASLKIRKWLEQEKLDAFTIAFPGITRKDGWATVPFLECTKAMARGIGYAGEGDVLTAAVTRCLADVFPETSFTEMFCPDWKNNQIFTSHMGEINMDICSAKLNLHEMKYSFSDTGNPMVATGCFKSGKAVLTDLAPGPNGTFTLISAPVTYNAPEGPSEKRNAGWFRPDAGSIADFLAAYSRLGGTHHLTCCYDADISIIRDWAALMNWKFAELA